MKEFALSSNFSAKKKLKKSSRKNQSETELKIQRTEEGQRIASKPYAFSEYSKKKFSGMEYLKKYEWKHGTGLGKDSKGIIYPLEASQRPIRNGIGSLENGEASSHTVDEFLYEADSEPSQERIMRREIHTMIIAANEVDPHSIV